MGDNTLTLLLSLKGQERKLKEGSPEEEKNEKGTVNFSIYCLGI